MGKRQDAIRAALQTYGLGETAEWRKPTMFVDTPSGVWLLSYEGGLYQSYCMAAHADVDLMHECQTAQELVDDMVAQARHYARPGWTPADIRTGEALVKAGP